MNSVNSVSSYQGIYKYKAEQTMKTLCSFLCVRSAAVSGSNSASHLRNDLFESYLL